MKMKEISYQDLSENFIQTIGSEWMLITSGDRVCYNTMTASWGGLGWLWNKPVAFIFVRPERFTHAFLTQFDYVTLSFLGEKNKDIHQICGQKSGRDIDKIKEAGLKTQFTERGSVVFQQSRLTLECRKLYMGDLKPELFIDREPINKWYDEEHGGFHKMYILEIEHIWKRTR